MCGLLFYIQSDSFQAKRLIRAIRRRDIGQVAEIVKKKPTCINVMPSKLEQFWRTLNGERVAMCPLNEACFANEQEMIKLLVEADADVNINDGQTPLSTVYRYKQNDWYELSVYLIEQGASVDYTTRYGGEFSSILCDIIMPKPITGDSEYTPEAENEVYEAFKYALENCNLDEVNWVAVLCQSIGFERMEIVKLLLENGYCNINDTYESGLSPLMVAVRDSDAEMVELLLSFGADKTLVTKEGKTVIDYANQKGDEDILRILMD